ncbi:MAG: trypsin-like peptidase domain-containing protein [Bryobacteraceae bacterium]
MVRPIALLTALVGMIGSAELGTAQSKSPRQIAHDTLPSVVLLVIQDSSGEPMSLGSGFVLRDGLVVTNEHVVSGGRSGYCRLAGKSVSYQIAGTVAVDIAHDLAIMAIDGLRAPALPIGDSGQLAAGDTVYVMGNPEGLEGTFSQGIVSAIRDIRGERMLQITAPVSPGSSGGPILDGGGNVVGIAEATFKEGQNLNLAIPSSRLVVLSATISANVVPLWHQAARAEARSTARPGSQASVPRSGTEVKDLQRAGEQGDVSAQFSLGRAYLTGEGVPKDLAEAFKWYHKAAEQGDASAESMVGTLYDSGEGVRRNSGQALEWYRKAAEQGDSFGEVGLAILYANGRGVPRDDHEALKWIIKSAQHGNALGQLKLGGRYLSGEGVPQDYSEAAKWFRKAAEQGNVMAQQVLARAYLYGEGVPKDGTEAIRWFREAAEQGDAESCRGLGAMYAEGSGVPQDYAESLKWFRKAADQGDVGGEVGLGVLYALGHGVPQDFTEAEKWYHKAANQGDADAQFNLSRLYDKGANGPADRTEAVKWLRMAAEQGHGKAQCLLGMHYRFGAGVPKDYVSAYMWLNLSAAASHELQAEAAKQRDDLTALMTRGQVSEAQRLAREWKPAKTN